HLDVYFPSYEMWEFGKMINESRFMTIGKLTFNAFSHGISTKPGDWEFPVPGEQGEQFMQTNYSQGPCSEKDWRGGFNRWNPSWIIATVLEAGLNFKE